MILILMGVAGAGKTTIGLKLASEIGWHFHDADDFHPPENLRKLARGQALTDEDRAPWLAALRRAIVDELDRGDNAVIACSALKEAYRRVLAVDDARVKLVYLKGSAELVRQRLRNRSGHFVKEDLLASQFATLEEPAGALTIDIDDRPGRIVERIRDALGI
jgi:gluconokinase